jgi:rsbT co-antagonist protein RsbR
MTDTEAELRAKIEAAKVRAETARGVIAAMYDECPDGIAVAHPDGKLDLNPVAASIVGDADPSTSPDGWSDHFGLFKPDRVTRMPTEELPLVRAMRDGVSTDDFLMWIRGPSRPDGAWIRVSARPLPGGGGIAVFRDVTAETALEADIAERTAALAARDLENRELIERLRVSLDDLSTPVLELWQDVLALPVIGLVDTQRSAQMTEHALAEIARQRSRFLLLDLTAVEIVDTSTADRILKLVRSAGLLGAQCIVTGIQPAVARTLVELGVPLGGIETRRNLRQGLDHCRAKLAEQRPGAPGVPLA